MQSLIRCKGRDQSQYFPLSDAQVYEWFRSSGRSLSALPHSTATMELELFTSSSQSFVQLLMEGGKLKFYRGRMWLLYAAA
ncbi:hypothetical protein Dsin_002254 [Dipteronia sinensis]|uniref:Uncharacterized protein n=1 Tax=Dipteronia sinensis TaxID=43782 RepID=A0AAE0B6B4_9ROSI|nr:hypothetical protein Dsin_002254 [Dipteronia sinensis]